MSSLANLPEVIGFFSYSREDDEAFRGTLSALRDAIQRELGAQLGRSKRNFRLWQDQEAISPGKLWESEIKTAVEQSVFFIPIVTPRVVNSQYCQFEFESFLARERSLGRADLVFPILYISVPALDDEAQWRNHPVLSAIARRQYVDWRSMRHLDIQSTAVREAVERFCRKIVEALQQSWQSPEERRRREEAEADRQAQEERSQQEAAAQRREDEKRRQQEVEAEQREREEARRKNEEAEAQRRAEADKLREAGAAARRRAEDERRSGEAEAKQRADQDRKFETAKRADAVSAVDEFLAVYPESYLATQAKALRTMLVEREEAYSKAISSDDATVLGAFLARYPDGTRANKVRRQLRRIQPRQAWRPSKRMLAIGGLALAVGLGTLLFISGQLHAPTSEQPTIASPAAAPSGEGSDHINRGQAYFDAKNYDLAVAEYNQAIALDPKNATAYFLRGQAYGNKNDDDRAIADYSQAIALDPKYAEAYVFRGIIYEFKYPDRAIADFSQAVALNPQDSLSYTWRADTYFAKGDFDRAIADYAQSIKVDPKWAYVYRARGNAYRAKGDPDRAIADYIQTIKVDSDYPTAFLDRALVYFYAGSPAKALADLDQASKLDPKNADVAIWTDIVSKRSNVPSRLALAVQQIDMTKWPAPVLRFYLGQSTPGDVLAAADDPDPNTKKFQVCQANFYTGELSLQQGKKDDATRLFRLAAAACAKDVMEWVAARAELKALPSVTWPLNIP
jgi:tetratricopeptide (TPR) repeat protein